MLRRRWGHRRPPRGPPIVRITNIRTQLADHHAAAQPDAMKSSMWIYAAAGYNVALAAFHLGFCRMFRWREELPKLHPANQGVMQVMNIMLTVFFLLMAGLQILRADEVVPSPLGRTLMAGLMGFWL